MNRTRIVSLLAGLCIVVLSHAAPALSGQPPAEPEFALVGDPQIGYGQGGRRADAARFRLVAEHIAAGDLELTVIAGDLVQDRTVWQRWSYDRVAALLPGRVLAVPGNHDIIDRASLAEWRRRHGADYGDAVWRNMAFILLNSETLRDSSISADENARQWKFLEQRLADHRAAGLAHIVLVMHRPPFVAREDEPEEGANWPPQARARLLALARTFGVRLILAGHLHRTARLATADGIQIIIGAGSARSFDQSPVAYHRIGYGPDGLQVRQVIVAPAPREPFSVPGVPQWTPRLFDFSFRHWMFTLLYAGAGWLALRAARRHHNGHWMAAAVLLFFFAVNMQLDFDEVLREALSLAARAAGVQEIRHQITGAVGIAAAVLAAALWAARWKLTDEKPSLLALGLLAPSTAWFFLSMISHHDWGLLFDEEWWDLAILASLAGIATCSVRSR